MRGFRDWYSRRSRGARRLLLSLVGLLLLGSGLWFTPTPYYVTAPGAAIDTSRLIQVPGGQAHANSLFMLVVTSQPANLFWYLYAKVDHRAVLESKEQFLGPIEDYDLYLELTRKMMADSQQTAKALALEQLGYGHGVQFEGVEVSGLSADSPSAGHLQAGDVIIAVAGEPVHTSDDLRAVTLNLPGGAHVDVVVRRGDQEVSLSVLTGVHPEPSRNGSAYFGIVPTDHLRFDIPVPVEINSGLITGPSAGLMFTLQIIDQLSPESLARGNRIAGTGTIEPDGRIGAIGGVQQKVYTAEAAGAQLFLVPRANFADAAQVATRIRVVPVDTLAGALTWLRENVSEAGQGAPPFGLTCTRYRSCLTRMYEMDETDFACLNEAHL